MKRALADVLWEAANERLYHPDLLWTGKCCYSCNALAYAWRGTCVDVDHTDLPHRVKKFLFALGCDTSIDGLFDYRTDEETQGIRYIWLLLAAHVAEDEGLYV